ncbi:uncharacterized protein EI90DRAFT_3133326 [Cantharellus anzutake]|uniref:uncharacterized protein n=1 Tax=Cantharellus anzutake TaxID=1750568 RepID=UPI001905A407|nr:uncharacterized protein EI90DRAFT_3133326 [Cantharellus anzutake]KAF8318276.1 hypothetical protein EI90DRAFT_3133326 [Cantharellus anzutake]
MDSSGLTEEIQPSQPWVTESASPEPQQTCEAKITPASGPFDMPDDTEVSYNACPLPADFDYKVLGMHSPHLHLNITDEACEAWNQANEHAVIIIPLYMVFSLTKMQEAKDHASTFIKRAFPDSVETLSTIPAANAIDAQGDDPLPWGIMIDGLTLCDATTLLYHQFWLSNISKSPLCSGASGVAGACGRQNSRLGTPGANSVLLGGGPGVAGSGEEYAMCQEQWEENFGL